MTFVFDGFLSQATRSPRYGAIIGVGGTMVADLRGKHTVYPENNRSALAYLDPILPPESANIALYWGMSSTSTAFPTAQQVPVRLGANGRSDMLLSYGSERRSGQSGKYMFDTALGRVKAEALIIKSGTTAERPISPTVGEVYFDTTLGLMIVWNGTAWSDFAGNTV